MKLPLRWLSEFVTVEAEEAELCRRLTLAGLEVENIERVRPAFSGVVVARVANVARHPNADRLSLCEVEYGADRRLTIVCGAPNVKAGMMAPLARVGARLGGTAKGRPAEAGAGLETVPPLEAAVIRGVRSEGMLCSERELGFSDEHSVIMELDRDAPLGADLAQYLELEETVLDIAVTPNRGDCLSVLGLAREVAALFGLRLNYRPPKPRPWRAADGGQGVAPVVEILAPDLCPRYAALAMTELRVGPSPMWLRHRLELGGMRALNNVVDATNYVMLELGQPLHAFDFERLAGRRIVVRRAGDDREFVTLDGIRRELHPSDLMIADGKKPLAIAGVMGGLNSEVGPGTRTILLESAYFEPSAIARTSRRLGLRSEASYRFERGIDRAGQVAGLARVAALLRKVAGGREAAPILDVEPRPAPPREIDLDLGRMAGLLGVEVSAPEAKRRLKALGAQVSSAGRGRLRVTPPSFRPDLNEGPDLAEEVARLSGLVEIPEVLPVRSAAVGTEDLRRSFIASSRETLLGCGLTEARTLAFIAPEENHRFPALRHNQQVGDTAAPVVIANPLSAEMSEMRLSLIPCLLGALRFNLNREANAFHAFEIGKALFVRDGQPREEERLAAVSYGTFAFSGIGQPGIKAGFFTLKGVLETYLRSIGIGGKVEFSPSPPSATPYLHPGKSARLNFEGAVLGYLGELHPQEAQLRELSEPCIVFELDLGSLIAYGSTPPKAVAIEAPPKFPAIRRDLALVVDRNFPAEAVVRTVARTDAPFLESVELFDAYEGGSIPPGKKSVAVSCRYRAKDRTLTDEEVNRAHALLTEKALEQLKAELRR